VLSRFCVSDASMFRCTAYGLALQCNVPIPGLREDFEKRAVDVQLTLGSIPSELVIARNSCGGRHYLSPEVAEGRPALEVYQLQGGRFFQLEYADDTKFVVDAEGCSIWATWPDTATLEDTVIYLLGPILGFVLRLRGVTCLHASAVVIQDRAVAFVGPSGAGKSSIAAAFAQRGHAVLSDDVVALSDRGDSFLVQPAYPRVRLWPESVEALFGSPDALPRLTPTWDKRFLELSAPARFPATPLPLAAVYILGERRSPSAPVSIHGIAERTALMELVSNTYTSYLLNSAQRAQEFELLGRLLEHVPLNALNAEADLKHFEPTCRAIIDHFSKMQARSHGESKTGEGSVS
jgi:hypothetical protein